MLDLLRTAASDALATQQPPSLLITLASATAALLLIVPVQAWRISRNLVTITHEGGHALVARLSGRQLSGIKLHSDTSGVTITAGRAHGLGMIATTFAGYVAPSITGALLAVLLTHGKVSATLWGSVTALIVMALFVRNLFGALVLVVPLILLAGLLRYGNETIQVATASAVAWFLLLGAVKPVRELQRKRREGAAPDSDADQLASLTGIPGDLWVVAFQGVNLAALAATVYLLLRA